VAEPVPGRDVSVEASEAVYCDAGRHLGMFRVDLRVSVYLSPQDLAAVADRGFLISIAEARSG
jgi:hypothetical protein